jgi:predicted PurR-regulated permease PerM
MLGLSHRAARITWTILVIVALLAFVYAVRSTVLVFMTAMFLAYVLWPAVALVERHAPRWMGRTFALIIVYIVFWGALVAIVVTVGVNLFEQASSFAQNIQGMIKKGNWLNNMFSWLGEPARKQITDWITAQFSSGGAALLPYLQGAGQALRGTLASALYFVLVPILAFFFIKDGRDMRSYIVQMFADSPRQILVNEILEDIHVMLGHYIRVLVTLALISVIVYSVFLGIVGVPYSVLLAFQAAVLEFIPVIGPIIGGIIMLIVAGFAGFQHLWLLVVFWLIYRLFQDYFLSPHLMHHGVQIHPLVVLFGVLAGEQIGGVSGMFFSVPLIAIFKVILVHTRRTVQRRRVLKPSEVPSP